MFRWYSVRIACGVLGIVLIAAAFVGVHWWWTDRPEQIYNSASTLVKNGEEALKNKDFATAQKAFDEADNKLLTIINKKKDSDYVSKAFALRYRLLSHRARIASLAEAVDKKTGPRMSYRYAAVAHECAMQAAKDVNNVEAQACMLQVCFSDNQLEQAGPYAQHLIDVLPNQSEGVKNELHASIMGAYFVVARQALRATPPKPDSVLDYVVASDAAQVRWANAIAAGGAPMPDTRTRWRMINLEAQALLVKSKLEQKQGGGIKNREIFQAKVAEWLARLNGDLRPIVANSTVSSISSLSASEMRGLFEFLTLVTEQAFSREDAVEKVRLTFATWAALAGSKVPARDNVQEADRRKIALQEIGRHFNQWSKVLDAVPQAFRFRTEDWKIVYPVLETVGDRLLEAQVPIDMTSNGNSKCVLLEMARAAQKNGDAEDAARFIELGLRVASAQRMANDSPEVLSLHATGAWFYLFMPNRTQDVDRHLDALPESKQSWGDAPMVEVIRALEDGNLEQGDFKLRMNLDKFGSDVIFTLSLAYLNLAAGKYDQALPILEKLEPYLRQSAPGSSDQIQAERFGLDRDGYHLELFRCRLALGDMPGALAEKKKLWDKPQWVAASVTLIRHRLGLGPTAAFAQQTPTAESLRLARQELDAVLLVARHDPRVLLAEAEWYAASEGTERAERFLREAADGPKNTDDAKVVLTCWLLRQGGTAEAGKLLDGLEKPGAQSPQHRERIKHLRQQWQTATSKSAVEANRLIGLLGVAQERGAADIYLASMDGVSRYEAMGAKLLWDGQAALARGDREQAGDVLSQAITFASVRMTARWQLLSCLLQMRDAGQPPAAKTLVVPALQRLVSLTSTGRYDPLLLVGFIENAIPLNLIYGGGQNARGAMLTLKDVVAERTRDLSGVYTYQAQKWLEIGRPDRKRALDAIRLALTFNPTRQETLETAVAVTRADGYWKASLQYADDLIKHHPAHREAELWRAEALAHLGDTAKARAAFQQFITRFPDRADGYRGLAGILETQHDYAAALEQVKQWHTHLPQDVQVLETEVRLLTRKGSIKEAQDAVKQAMTVENAAAALAAARGFLVADRPIDALKWAKRAEASAQRPLLFDVRGVLGDICVRLAASANSEAERKQYFDQAIDYYSPADPLHPYAGWQLAQLQSKDRERAGAAFATVQLLCQGRYGKHGVTADRLPERRFDILAQVYIASKHYQATVQLLMQKEVVERYGQEPIYLLRLGQAYTLLGQKSEAKQYLDAAMEGAGNRANDERATAAEKKYWSDVASEAHDMLLSLQEH